MMVGAGAAVVDADGSTRPERMAKAFSPTLSLPQIGYGKYQMGFSRSGRTKKTPPQSGGISFTCALA